MSKQIQCLLTALSLLLLLTQPAWAQRCATVPPPEGLVARCRKLDMLVPSSQVELTIRLAEWMKTCAVRNRGDSLVYGNESVSSVWDLIKDLRGTAFNSVRILPEYEASRFTQDEQTCYGIAAVKFKVWGAEGVVVDPCDARPEDCPEVDTLDSLSDFSDEMVKAAALAGEQALREHPGSNGGQRARMQNVLLGMKTHGKSFDDLFFNIAPYATFGDWNDPTCYKEFSAGRGYVCRELSVAHQTCEIRVGVRLVMMRLSGAATDYIAKALLGYASDIDRGISHLHTIVGAESPAAIPCSSVKDFFIPKFRELAGQPNSLYFYWDRGP